VHIFEDLIVVHMENFNHAQVFVKNFGKNVPTRVLAEGVSVRDGVLFRNVMQPVKNVFPRTTVSLPRALLSLRPFLFPPQSQLSLCFSVGAHVCMCLFGTAIVRFANSFFQTVVGGVGRRNLGL
jgi:hypothetical protein